MTRRLTIPMRTALARLQVAISLEDGEAVTQAGIAAAGVVDWQRLRVAAGYYGTLLMYGEEIPRGWVLAFGDDRAAVHPSSLPHMLIAERAAPIVVAACSLAAGAHDLSALVMTHRLDGDLDLLAELS